jgi:predicted small metal-binding protein
VGKPHWVSEKGDTMAKQINCECGYIVRGENDDEVAAKAEEHIRDKHPELVGTMSRDELLAMATDA